MSTEDCAGILADFCCLCRRQDARVSRQHWWEQSARQAIISSQTHFGLLKPRKGCQIGLHVGAGGKWLCKHHHLDDGDSCWDHHCCHNVIYTQCGPFWCHGKCGDIRYRPKLSDNTVGSLWAENITTLREGGQIGWNHMEIHGWNREELCNADLTCNVTAERDSGRQNP